MAPATRSPSRKSAEGFSQWKESLPRVERDQNLGIALHRLIDSLGIAERLSEQKAIEIWRDVVGQQIATVTEATQIKDGVLLVKVSSPSWRHELTFMVEQIKSRLNAVLGRDVVKRIRLC